VALADRISALLTGTVVKRARALNSGRNPDGTSVPPSLPPPALPRCAG
jgi:hypothetical protein